MADDKNQQTIDGGPKPPRHHTDRMLKPQRGMGKPHLYGGTRKIWICPTCSEEVWDDEKKANRHRC